MSSLDIIAVTFHQDEPLKGFINCIKSQTNPNWTLSIIHDGEDAFFHELKEDLIKNDYLNDERITFDHTPNKGDNPWGHGSRDYGMSKYLKSEYLVHTNVDNYYAPVFVDLVLDELEDNPNVEFLFYDCIHSHHNYFLTPPGSYGHLTTLLQEGMIDMGCVVAKTEIAKKIGFRYDNKNADWFYFSDLLQIIDPSNVRKLNKILFVHN